MQSFERFNDDHSWVHMTMKARFDECEGAMEYMERVEYTEYTERETHTVLWSMQRNV